MRRQTHKMGLAVVTAVAVAAVSSACRNAAPEVGFCDVLVAPEKFEDRELSTELVAIPNYHGWYAVSFNCSDYLIAFSDAPMNESPELRALEQSIEQIYDKPGPPRGVLVRVTARIEKSNSSRRSHVLRLLSASKSTIVELPAEFLRPPTNIEPIEKSVSP